MNIHFRGDHHLEVTPALREYVQKKLSRIDKLVEPSATQDVNVTMGVTHGNHIVEIMMPLGAMIIRAEERSDDMYASIDLVMDKLEKQVDKFKHKLGPTTHRSKNEQAKLKSSSFASILEGSTVPENMIDEEYPVVRVKQFEMKPMHVSEAILQMGMLGHDFYVFSNAESDQPCVVYKRKDGRYGLIETQ